MVGAVDATGSITMEGSLEARLNLAAVVYESRWTHAAASAQIHVENARLVVVNSPFVAAHTMKASPAGEEEQEIPASPRDSIVEEFPFSGNLTVTNLQDDASIRFLPAKNFGSLVVHQTLAGRHVFGPPGPDSPSPSTEPPPFTSTFESHSMSPLGVAAHLTTDQIGGVELRGGMVVFAYGANVDLDGTSSKLIATGKYPRLTYSDPLGYQASGAYDRFYVVLLADHATARMGAAQADAWHLKPTSVAGRFVGDAAFAAVSGNTTVDHRYLRQDLGLLQVVGDFAVSGNYRPEASHWTLDGQATVVAADGQIAVSGFSGAGLAVAGGLGLLAALWLVRPFRDLLLGLFARSARPPALQHPRRQALHEAIRDEPGMSFRELQRRLGIPSGPLQNHLRRLLEARLIVVQRHLNTVRYFENHGRYSNHWHEVVQLRDPDALRLHAWVQAHPSQTQAGIVAQTQGWGWSRPATQRRLRHLADAGLLHAAKAGRSVRYTARIPTRPPLRG